MSDIEIIEWGLKRLKSIFGPDLPTMVNHKVTRWGKDPFSRGCYTYLPRGASGEHYDILGQPILGMGFGLLFGGEHTVKEHPDTVGGAFISGVREVQRVLSLFGLQPLKVEETQKENEEDKFCIIREDGYDSFGRKIRKHGQVCPSSPYHHVLHMAFSHCLSKAPRALCYNMITTNPWFPECHA